MHGEFISFDGPEGTGKSTVCGEIVKIFSDKDILVVREPGSTPVGEKIRAILKSKDLIEHIPGRAELFLFEAARACIIDQVINPALAAGKNVLCDRFFDSTTAYQGYGRELDVDIEEMNMLATNFLSPSLTIFFDLPYEVGRARMAKRGQPTDRIEAAGEEFHNRVRHGFLSIAKLQPERCRVVNAEKSLDEVVSEVCSIIKSKFGWN